MIVSSLLRRATFAALLATAACSSSDDAPLPLADAERARELTFLSTPRSRTLDRDTYLAQQDAEGAALTDAEVAFAQAVWGRLGYFAADFDVRTVSGERSQNVAAFYSPRDKLITLFPDSRPATVVHELVHALQDQHFDFLRYADVPTLDEALARRAVAEGDAEVCEARFDVWEAGGDPFAALPPALTPERTEAGSARIFAAIALPAFFAADVGFVYPFGRSFVGRRLGLLDTPPTWNRANDDALFRDRPPASSEEVLRTALGLPVDPVEPVAIGELPAGVSDRLELGDVDRLGAWYVRVLFGATTPLGAQLGLGWDGDEIAVLVAKGAGEAPPAGVLWTAVWEDEATATVAFGALAALQAAPVTDAKATATLPNGDAVHVERRARRTVLVRGRVAPEDLAAVADRALGPSPVTTALRAPRRLQLPPRVRVR